VANGEPTDDLSTPDPAGHRPARLHAEGGGGRHRRVRRAQDRHGGPGDAQALTSPPPEPPGAPNRPRSRRQAPPGTASRPGPGTQPTLAAGRRETARTELPRTGANLDRLVAAGLATTAGGAALVLWNAEAKAGAKSAEERPKA
jgi:hypothetical protein